MDPLKRNMIFSIVLILILYLIGIYVYHYIEGWSYLDSVYFQTMTFTTVGYGDITPQTNIGKVFTMVIAWVGISVAFYILYNVSTYRQRYVDDKVSSFVGQLRPFAILASRKKNKKTNNYRSKEKYPTNPYK